MKKILDYLKGLMSDETNSPSFKRYIALAGFIVAIVIAFTNLNTENIISFLGFAGLCLGLTTGDKFSQKWIK